VTAGAPSFDLRAGPSYWWQSYLMMVRWELTNLRLLLPVTVMVQVISGAGFVLGVGLFFADIPERAALFVSTGVLVITLVLVGLVMGPQLIAQQKQNQTYDFMWSLPIPRITAAAAWVTMNMVIALPGMAVAVAVAVWRYDLPFHISASVIPAVLLVLLTGTMIGYALAHVIGNPMLMQLITQITIFVILGFSPINFPRGQLPAWLATVNDWLPFHHMANVVRGSVTTGVVEGVARSYVALSVYAVMATAVTAVTLKRRG
jgi:ABC-2 type transport system permease protein